MGHGPGFADANSPLPGLAISLKQYQTHGIAASKIVMGLPWYGYDYTCDDSGKVAIPGSPCKVAGGSVRRSGVAVQVPYWKQLRLLRSNLSTTALLFNNTVATSWFDYVPNRTAGIRHQVWMYVTFAHLLLAFE